MDAGELGRLAAAGGLRLKLSDPPGGGGRARWYALWLQPTLFGGVDLVRSWGRLGTTTRRPRQLASAHPDEPAAQAALDKLLARRLRRGYRPAGAPPARTAGAPAASAPARAPLSATLPAAADAIRRADTGRRHRVWHDRPAGPI